MGYSILKRLLRAFASVTLLLAAITSSVAVTYAQESTPSVMPTLENGKVTLVGSGFRSDETVEITIRVGGTSYSFTVTADAGGSFRLRTKIVVTPGTGLEYEGKRSDGSGFAGIAEPVPPGTMPQTGASPVSLTPILVAGMVLALGIGSMLLGRASIVRD